MKLLERLHYHIQKFHEEKWDYVHTKGGVVEYVEDPKNDNSFRKFIKDYGNYARCAFVKGKWYFWPAKHSTHDDFIKSLGLYNYWDQWHKLEVQMNGSSLELGFQIISDWEEMFREDIKELGIVSNDTLNIVKSGVSLILDLHKKYGLKLDQQEMFRLKKLLAYKKPAGTFSYENTYGFNYSSDASKIARKQNKYWDKSLPKKDRLSRIGWKWNKNPDKFDWDLNFKVK